MTKPKLYYAHITRTHTHCPVTPILFLEGARAGCAPAWIRACIMDGLLYSCTKRGVIVGFNVIFF